MDTTNAFNSIRTSGSLGLKVAPRLQTSHYLELHKLDYEKRRIYIQLSAMESKRSLLEERLRAIESEMGLINSRAEKSTSAPPVKSAKGNGRKTQKLKY